MISRLFQSVWLSWVLMWILIIPSQFFYLLLPRRWSEAGSEAGRWSFPPLFSRPHSEQPIPDQRSHANTRNGGTVRLHHWHDTYVGFACVPLCSQNKAVSLLISFHYVYFSICPPWSRLLSHIFKLLFSCTLRENTSCWCSSAAC